MGKSEKKARYILAFVGWICLLRFMKEPALVAEVGSWVDLLALAMLVYVVITGFGLLICSELTTSKSSYRGGYLFFFTAFFLLIEIILTITPALSSCRCIGFSENLRNIKDWSRCSLAFVWFMLSFLFWFIDISPRISKGMNKEMKEEDFFYLSDHEEDGTGEMGK